MEFSTRTTGTRMAAPSPDGSLARPARCGTSYPRIVPGRAPRKRTCMDSCLQASMPMVKLNLRFSMCASPMSRHPSSNASLQNLFTGALPKIPLLISAVTLHREIPHVHCCEGCHAETGNDFRYFERLSAHVGSEGRDSAGCLHRHRRGSGYR